MGAAEGHHFGRELDVREGERLHTGAATHGSHTLSRVPMSQAAALSGWRAGRSGGAIVDDGGEVADVEREQKVAQPLAQLHADGE